MRTAIETVVIKTTGDRVQDRALAEIGGKALWTKELDRALLAGEIDCAVHSMKDVETVRPAAIAIAAMLPRADVRDRLIGADSIEALPKGALIGTSSPRRQAQLLRLRPDLRIVLLRGNVDTRLGKVADGTVGATLLAAAGSTGSGAATSVRRFHSTSCCRRRRRARSGSRPAPTIWRRGICWRRSMTRRRTRASRSSARCWRR